MTAITHRIATIRGTFATPGVSKNRRLYTREHIASAVAEAQAQIASGDGLPVTMLTGHGGRRDSLGADVTDTAGRVTKVSLSPEGHGLFEADIADTAAGRDVAALAAGGYLKGVSMAGVWKGIPRRVTTEDGGLAETADGVSLRGIDFTHSPGVIGAQITSAQLAESVPADLICEALEEVVFVEETDGSTTTVTEAAAKALTPGGDYADPGWQKDGKKRYPLDTAQHVKSAWSFINVKANQEPYSASQVSRIKTKIKKAAKRFDINISESMRTLGLAALEAATDDGLELTGLSEVAQANLLRSIGMQITSAIAEADPVALAEAGGEDDDDQMDDSGTCTECGGDVAADANFCPACGAPVPQGESAPEKKGAVMPEAKQTEGAVSEDAPITQATLEAAVKAAVEQTLEAVAEAGKPVEESDEIKAARALIAEADAAKTTTETTTTAATVTETAPAAGFTKEDVDKMIAEATEAASKATLEAVRAEVKETIQMSGRRNGYVSKSVLEQDTSELYGENADLSKLSLAELSRVTDTVVAPLIGAATS